MDGALLRDGSGTWMQLSRVNTVHCQSLRQEPREDETPDVMELAREYQAKTRKAK